MGVETRHGKKVSVDDITGRINLAQSLGMNTPYKGRELLEQEMDDLRKFYSPEEMEKK